MWPSWSTWYSCKHPWIIILPSFKISYKNKVITSTDDFFIHLDRFVRNANNIKAEVKKTVHLIFYNIFYIFREKQSAGKDFEGNWPSNFELFG